MMFQVNQILVEGGFAPEWIMLKRDIIDQRNDLKKMLFTKCQEIMKDEEKRKYKFKNEKLDNIDSNTHKEWKKYCDFIENNEEILRNLNKNIDRFNLIVPMMKSQMFHFNLKKEADKIYSHCLEEQKLTNGTDIKEANDEIDKNDISHQESKVSYKSPISVLEDLLKSLVVLIKRKDER